MIVKAILDPKTHAYPKKFECDCDRKNTCPIVRFLSEYSLTPYVKSSGVNNIYEYTLTHNQSAIDKGQIIIEDSNIPTAFLEIIHALSRDCKQH